MTEIQKPLFTIGVPTYNRKNLLKQTLSSILQQTFTDFEVIVGNDFPEEVLSLEMLGINDPRMRVINHKRNMGELENMNYLLSVAQGKYFTWQFDDDPCAPTFLSEVYSALIKFEFPTCVFTSFAFIYSTSYYKFNKTTSGKMQLFPGPDFLRKYLSGNVKALGCCGIYKTEYLLRIGGAKRLTNGLIALHSEYLLLIGAGMVPNIAYINKKLVSSRIHENSWTCANDNVDLFKQAGITLMRESIRILSDNTLKNDFHKNIKAISKFVISSVVVKIAMSNKQLNMQEIIQYRSLIEKEFHSLKGTVFYEMAMTGLDIAIKNIPLYKLKAILKKIIPLKYLKFVHKARSLFS